MKARTILALALTAILAGTATANAQAPEKKDVKLGVGGQAGLYYIALTLADALGNFKAEGLNVEINDFAGGAKSLQALVGGSVDVVTGAYEHTIRMQAKGQDILSVIELGRFPGISLVVRKEKMATYKSPADLKGWTIGVSAPGSSTNMIVWSLMTKAGLKTTDASFVGVGTGATAYAAMQKGEIDALSSVEPTASKLQQDGIGSIVAETSTPEGSAKVLGGPMSAAVLYTRRDFIEKYPGTTQALVNAFYKTLQWMQKATPEQIADKVPVKFLVDDRALVLASLKASAAIPSRDGIISPETQQRSLDFLKGFDKELANAKLDLSKTWDGRFVKKAAETIK
ncbi:MAG: ABC transporter substrate-binding protein [Bacteroidota bacterium]